MRARRGPATRRNHRRAVRERTRRVAPQLISNGDSVLSAGVALESQAELLKRLAGRIVCVDVPRKASQSRQELFRSDDDVRPLTRAGDVTAALRPDENFDCVVVDVPVLVRVVLEVVDESVVVGEVVAVVVGVEPHSAISRLWTTTLAAMAGSVPCSRTCA